MQDEKTVEIDIDKEPGLLKKLDAGIYCLLSGNMFVMRDAAHKRIKEMIDNGENIPVSFKDSIIYYMGPAPARPGKVIGSAGPTSSYRMDVYLEMSLQLGIAATVGKGGRSSSAIDLIRKYKAPYLVTIGGAGAYLAGCIISSKTVLFDDLGPEAVIKITVEKFPVIVGIDISGRKSLKE